MGGTQDLDVISSNGAAAGSSESLMHSQDSHTQSAPSSTAGGTTTATESKKPETVTRLSFWKKAKDLAIKHWFLEGLIVAILLALAYPPLGKKGGLIRAEYTVKYGVVAFIFIISGMSLKTRVLAQALISWRYHLVIQIISLGFAPAFGYSIARLLLLGGFDPNLVAGLIIATSTPTTISSNVLMTKQASGNESIALMNAVIGNIIGVFISPSLIIEYLGSLGSQIDTGKGGAFDYSSVFRDLSITVLAPLIVGQVVQFALPKAVAWIIAHIPLANVNSGLLLVLIWNVFCDTFSSNISVDIGSLFAVIFLNIALFSLYTGVAFSVSQIKFLKIDKPTTVAVCMCAATKTVALGIPLINILFSGSPKIGVLSTPLLIYHAEQLVAGALLVPILKAWVEGRSQFKADIFAWFKNRSSPKDPAKDVQARLADDDMGVPV
ncbi:SBF-like CPA transporter family-domain-containing protein [Cladochytrium replicatum]|nr:SBF-like CPA transporter family-domain-containing protein [Cladochytrium replicatum]